MGVEQKAHSLVRQGHFSYGRSSRLGNLHVLSLIGTDIGPYFACGTLNYVEIWLCFLSELSINFLIDFPDFSI
jgi:hypothetical protein